MKMTVINTKATIKKGGRDALRGIYKYTGYKGHVVVRTMCEESPVNKDAYDYDLVLDVYDGNSLEYSVTYKSVAFPVPSHMLDQNSHDDLLYELDMFWEWANANFSVRVTKDIDIVEAQYVVRKRRIHAFSDSAYYKVCTKTKLKG